MVESFTWSSSCWQMSSTLRLPPGTSSALFSAVWYYASMKCGDVWSEDVYLRADWRNWIGAVWQTNSSPNSQTATSQRAATWFLPDSHLLITEDQLIGRKGGVGLTRCGRGAVNRRQHIVVKVAVTWLGSRRQATTPRVSRWVQLPVKRKHHVSDEQQQPDKMWTSRRWPKRTSGHLPPLIFFPFITAAGFKATGG